MSRPRADAAAVSPGDPPGTAAEDARTADDLDGLAGLIADWMRRPLRGAPIVTLNRIAWAPVAEDRPDDPWHRAAAAVDAAAAGEDRPGGPAERAALAAIADHPPGPRARALRAALAVRLAGLHGMAGAADRVLLPAGPAPDPEALLVVGRACRPFTAPYLAALEALAAGPAAGAPPSRHAILALRLWLGLAMAFSADAATLGRAVAHVARLGADRRARGEAMDRDALVLCLQFAALTGRERLPDPLRDLVAAGTPADLISPATAPLLASHPDLLAADAAALDRDLATARQVARDAAALAARLSDPATRIAVVGNSPCETGLGKGPRIDAADLVVRFNAFSTAPDHAADYGTRTDLWVANFKRGEADRLSVPAALWPSESDFLRQRSWESVRRYQDDGRAVSAVPAAVPTGLLKRIGRPPSAGLTFLHYLADLRAGLSGVGLYGFSFVDQIGPKAVSAHYFEQARPSMVHDWQREAEIFADLAGQAPGGDGA